MMQRIEYPNQMIAKATYYQTAQYAVKVWQDNEGKKAVEPLAFLAGAEYPDNNSAALEGATYKSLAYVAHRMGMETEERQAWYDVACRVGLSQAHIGIIISRLKDVERMHEQIDEFLLRG
jgi:hypothetical protein